MSKRLLSLLVCLFSCATIFAQSVQVRGKVIDKEGNPIPAASVIAKGTNNGVSASADGHFSIVVPSLPTTLIFSSIGFRQREYKVTDTLPLTIQLPLQVIEDYFEVVITGVAAPTATTKLSVSVTKIDESRLRMVPAMSAAGSLVGKVAGVRVHQGSGQPGAGIEILLRGDNNLNVNASPMILLDGIILSGTLADINADDIESIEVVKGAAASSLYGSRAGNGVISIITKRGRGGNVDVSRVIIRNEIGIQRLPKRLKLAAHHPYALASDWETFRGQYTKYDGVTYPNGYMGGFSAGITGNRALDADHYVDNPFGVNRDHQKDFFNKGINYTNYVGISTRSKLTNLYASFENNAQDGLLQYTNAYKRQNFRLNVDHQLARWLRLSASNLYINSTTQYPAEGGAIFFNIISADPDNNLHLEHPDGQPYFIRHNHWGNQTNPFYPIWKSKRNDLTRRWLGNYTVNLKLAEWLNIDATRTMEIENYRYTSYSPYDTWILGNAGGPLGIIYNKGSLGKLSFESNTQNTQATINTNFKWRDLTLQGKLSYLHEKRHSEDFNITGMQFAYRDLPTLQNFVPGNITHYGSTDMDIESQNYFAIASLDHKNKFMFDAMFRHDGSSLFGPEEKWHNYYRISGAYRITKDFDIPGVDELKIRAAHGTAGLRPDFTWQYETYFLFNGVATPNTKGNKELKPSKTRETEIGLYAQFLRKFSVEAVYAQSKTTDQFLNVPLIPFLNDGFINQWRNAGTIKSKTFELSLSADWTRNRDITWNSRLVFSTINQKITELPIPPYQSGQDGLFFIRNGESYGAIYGYTWVRSLEQMQAQLPAGKTLADYEINSDGYVVPTGSQGSIDEVPIQLLDANGDPAFVKIGDGRPKFNMGIANTISYKNFEFYFLIDVKGGGDVYNRSAQYLTRELRSDIVDMSGVADGQKKAYDYYLGFYDANSNNSYWVEKAGFVKLREVAISYTLPSKTLDVFKGVVKKATARIIGRNVLTFTKYSGYDPEVGSIREPYNGLGAYPAFRNIAFSLSLEF